MSRSNDAYAWTRHYAVSRPYTTNGLNHYTQAGSGAGIANCTYDANGNLATSPGPAQNEVLTYTYDIENRLIGRSGGVALGYDPLGRLLAVASPSTYTRFLYDGDALVAEYDGNNAMTRRYVHNEGADVPLLGRNGDTHLYVPFSLSRGGRRSGSPGRSRRRAGAGAGARAKRRPE